MTDNRVLVKAAVQEAFEEGLWEDMLVKTYYEKDGSLVIDTTGLDTFIMKSEDREIYLEKWLPAAVQAIRIGAPIVIRGGKAAVKIKPETYRKVAAAIGNSPQKLVSTLVDPKKRNAAIQSVKNVSAKDIAARSGTTMRDLGTKLQSHRAASGAKFREGWGGLKPAGQFVSNLAGKGADAASLATRSARPFLGGAASSVRSVVPRSLGGTKVPIRRIGPNSTLDRVKSAGSTLADKTRYLHSPVTSVARSNIGQKIPGLRQLGQAQGVGGTAARVAAEAAGYYGASQYALPAVQEAVGKVTDAAKKSRFYPSYLSAEHDGDDGQYSGFKGKDFGSHKTSAETEAKRAAAQAKARATRPFLGAGDMSGQEAKKFNPIMETPDHGTETYRDQTHVDRPFLGMGDATDTTNKPTPFRHVVTTTDKKVQAKPTVAARSTTKKKDPNVPQHMGRRDTAHSQQMVEGYKRSTQKLLKSDIRNIVKEAVLNNSMPELATSMPLTVSDMPVTVFNDSVRSLQDQEPPPMQIKEKEEKELAGKITEAVVKKLMKAPPAASKQDVAQAIRAVSQQQRQPAPQPQPGVTHQMPEVSGQEVQSIGQGVVGDFIWGWGSQLMDNMGRDRTMENLKFGEHPELKNPDGTPMMMPMDKKGNFWTEEQLKDFYDKRMTENPEERSKEFSYNPHFEDHLEGG